MLPLDVAVQTYLVVERLLAQMAPVGQLIRVDALVHFERPFTFERFIALRASVLPLVRVHHFVIVEISPERVDQKRSFM